LYYNTISANDTSGENKRLMKVGSCWGGFGMQGNSPTYYSPGHFKVMQDFHTSFPENERNYALPSNMNAAYIKEEWDQLIETSYDVLLAVQCPLQGIVPNWAMVDIIGDGIENTGDPFSGSGTPQWQYGTEAARTTWRVALDAAFFPEEMKNTAGEYLKPLLNTLKNGFDKELVDENYFSSDTFKNCFDRSNNENIIPFSEGWNTNPGILAPTLSSLVVPMDGLSQTKQEEILDTVVDGLLHITSENLNEGLYARTWRVLGVMVLTGAVESTGKMLAIKRPVSGGGKKHSTSTPISVETTKEEGSTKNNNVECCSFSDGCDSDSKFCDKNCMTCSDRCGGTWLVNGEEAKDCEAVDTAGVVASKSIFGEKGCCSFGDVIDCTRLIQDSSDDKCHQSATICKNGCQGIWVGGINDYQ